MSASFEQEMHTNNNQCGLPLNFGIKELSIEKRISNVPIFISHAEYVEHTNNTT